MIIQYNIIAKISTGYKFKIQQLHLNIKIYSKIQKNNKLKIYM